MTSKTIPVTRTSMPDFQEFVDMIKPCWESAWLTNNGPMVQKLEQDLRSFLSSNNVLLTNNGTTALQLAIRAFKLDKEIITTPFSYVATTSSILWEHCKPVFVDIDPVDLCIDVAQIESQITKNTQAILAVHVYGNPCDVIAIEKIASKHNLKVIYDAAHAFGAKYLDIPLANYGDASTLSFHSTKLFHTIEGGAIVTPLKTIAEDINLLRAFGHKQDDHFMLGINGKMNEIQAAMGLCNLPKIIDLINKRKVISDFYDSKLELNSEITTLKPRIGTERNYAYYPIILKDEIRCLKIQEFLKENDVLTRRYFYPSLNTLPYVEYVSCPVSEDISKRVLCLPLYSDMSISEAETVMKKIFEVTNG